MYVQPQTLAIIIMNRLVRQRVIVVTLIIMSRRVIMKNMMMVLIKCGGLRWDYWIIGWLLMDLQTFSLFVFVFLFLSLLVLPFS